MAGIGQESVQPLRVDASQFVAPLQLGVQQSAVALMADSFRQGQISYNDIAERYGALAKTKEKAQIQGLDEFLNPAAIQARQQHASLMSEKDKSELALLPVAEQAKRAEFESIRIKAAQGDKASMREYAIKNGFGPELSQPTGGNYTAENSDNDTRVYEAAVKYDQAIKSAADILKDIKQVPNTRRFTGSDGSVEENTDFNNPILTSETGKHTYTQEQSVRASRLSRMTPQQYREAGMPSADEYILGVKPPEAPQQPQEAAAKISDSVTPRITEESKTTKANGDVVEKRKVVESTGNAPQSIADLAPGQTFKAAPIAEAKGKQPTEAQQRAQTAIQKFAQSGRMEDAIAGYDPTTYSSWIAGLMPNFLRFGAQSRQTFEAARDLWQQGLLRMESGAAISPSEKAWYNTTFFPELNDPPALVESKGNARRGVEDTVAEIAQAGGVVSPESIHAAWDLKQQRAGTAATSTQAGRPAITVLDSGEEIIDYGNGGIMVRKSTSASTNAPPR